MNTSLDRHLHRLRRHYGTYIRAAHRLGITPRSFRRGRNNAMPRSTRGLIVAAGKLLVLRQLLRELTAAGDLAPDALRRAWKKLHASRS